MNDNDEKNLPKRTHVTRMCLFFGTVFLVARFWEGKKEREEREREEKNKWKTINF